MSPLGTQGTGPMQVGARMGRRSTSEASQAVEAVEQRYRVGRALASRLGLTSDTLRAGLVAAGCALERPGRRGTFIAESELARCEPLLGPVDLSQWMRFLPWASAGGPNECPHGRAEGIRCPECSGRVSWVIVGGESGPNARPVHPEWVRSLRDQCQQAKVPFFFKQWGTAGKKVAGAQLDGREWREFPVLGSSMAPQTERR